jgi:hypothetical protein
VHTVTTPIGVMCPTLCPVCAASDVPAPISIGTAERLVRQHREHLGLTPDAPTSDDRQAD